MQVQTKVMNNYMGIGVDAKVSLEFDRLRTKFPHWFKSQMGESSCLNPFHDFCATCACLMVCRDLNGTFLYNCCACCACLPCTAWVSASSSSVL